MRRRGRRKQAQALARSSPGWQTGTVRPRIGGTKAYNIYGFFVAELEVIYHAMRPFC